MPSRQTQYKYNSLSPSPRTLPLSHHTVCTCARASTLNILRVFIHTLRITRHGSVLITHVEHTVYRLLILFYARRLPATQHNPIYRFLLKENEGIIGPQLCLNPERCLPQLSRRPLAHKFRVLPLSYLLALWSICEWRIITLFVFRTSMLLSVSIINYVSIKIMDR